MKKLKLSQWGWFIFCYNIIGSIQSMDICWWFKKCLLFVEFRLATLVVVDPVISLLVYPVVSEHLVHAVVLASFQRWLPCRRLLSFSLDLAASFEPLLEPNPFDFHESSYPKKKIRQKNRSLGALFNRFWTAQPQRAWSQEEIDHTPQIDFQKLVDWFYVDCELFSWNIFPIFL